MITGLLMDIKQRLASHIEIRDIRIMLNSQRECSQRTLSTMERYAKFLANPTSDRSKLVLKNLSKQSGISPNKLYSELLSGMEKTHKRVEELITLYDGNNNRVMISSSLTTINANALHLAAICDFYEKSCRALTLSMSELESLHLRGEKIPKNLFKYMDRNLSFENLRSLGSILSYNKRKDSDKVVKLISEMDDIEVTEGTLDAAVAMGKSSKVDPAGFNYLNILNPSFWAYVGIKTYSELRLLHLDMEKDELELLEIRHQELAQLRASGESDLATSKNITKIKDRIDTLRYDIKEKEERLG